MLLNDGIDRGEMADTCFVHELAQVDEGCVIGQHSRVWQFASVIRKAKIGEDCSIASCSIIDGCTLGDRVIVGHGSFIGPGMMIGNDVFIAPLVTFCNDFWPVVSKDGWFDMDDLITGNTVVSIVRDGASIGAGAVIMPGIVIGTEAMIAAGAVVNRNVPDKHLFRVGGEIQLIDRKADRKRSVVR